VVTVRLIQGATMSKLSNKINFFIDKSKLAIKKTTNYLKTDEGKKIASTAAVCAYIGFAAGVILANKQDAKACGLTYAQLLKKIWETK